MSDFATLVLAADTRQMVTARKALDDVAVAGANAEKGADKAAEGLARVGKAGGAAGHGAGEAAAGLDKAARAGDRAGRGAAAAAEGMAKADRSAGGLAGAVGGAVAKLAALAAAAVSIGAYARMADAWSDMQSRIGAAVKDMDAAPALMQRMTEMANASYSPLSQTVEIFSRNVLVLRELGYTAGQAADYTESLNHMLVITATKGERAAAVQTALSKAMAIGALQAEGLETVLASGGRIAEALAAELGTTINGLRGMAGEGRITADVIAGALLGSLQAVRQEAGDMPATIADGFMTIGNSLMALVGTFDKAFGISASIAGWLKDVSDAIQALAFNTDFAAWGETAVSVMQALGDAALVLAATRIPAVIGIMATLGASAIAAAGSINLLNIALVASQVAMTAAAAAGKVLGAVIAVMGGPWGVLAAALALGGIALYNWSEAAGKAQISTFGHSEAIVALNAQLAEQRAGLAETAAEAAPGIAMSIDQARALLAEVEARRLAVAELRAQRLEMVMMSEAYNNVLELAIKAEQALAVQQSAGVANDPFAIAYPAAQAAAIAAKQKAVDDLNETLRRMAGMTREEAAAWAEVQAAIAAAYAALEAAEAATAETAAGAAVLAGNLGVAAGQAVSLAAAMAGADAAMADLGADLDTRMRTLSVRMNALQSGVNEGIAVEIDLLKQRRDAVVENLMASGASIFMAAEITEAQSDQIAAYEQGLKVLAATRAAMVGKGGVGKGSVGGGVAGAQDEMTAAAQRWIARIAAAVSPAEKFQKELAEINELLAAGALTAEQARAGIEILTDEMAGSISWVNDLANAWGDFVAGGFSDFKGLMDSIKSLLQRTIAEMIATAAKSAIMFQITGVANTVGGAGGAGGAGFLGSIGGLGGIFGSIGTGFGNVVGGLLNGGLGGAIKGLTGSLGSLGTAIGALGAVALGIGLIVSLFAKKVVDTGVRGTFGPDGFVGDSYTKKSGIFGSSTGYKPLDEDVTRALSNSFFSLRTSVKDMAGVLDLGTDALDTFIFEFKFSTKKMSEDEAARALEAELKKAGDAMSGLVLKTDDFIREGEGALDALVRLSTSLLSVNAMFDTLGHSFKAVGLIGAEVASKLIDEFGGLANFEAATGRFFQLFYSEEERRATLTRQIAEQLGKLNVAMPKTRDEYRKLIDSIDVTTDAGRKLYATLVSLADAFDFLLPGANGLSAAAAQLMGQVGTKLERMIGALAAAQSESIAAAGLWYQTAQTLRGFMRDLVNATTSAASPLVRLMANRRNLDALAGAVRGGDAGAGRELPRAAGQFLAAAHDMSGSALEYAREEARVRAELGFLAGVSELEAGKEAAIANVIGQQVELLTNLLDHLRSGGELDRDQIIALNNQLGSLENVVSDLRDLTYDRLMERIQVIVGLVPDAELPDDVRALMQASIDGIRADVDFFIRTDLPPDVKFLAVLRSSEHLKTIDFVARNGMHPDLAKLALTDQDAIRLTVHFALGQNLDPDIRQLALTAASDLSITVNAILAADIDSGAKRLALDNVGSYTVAIFAALHPRITKNKDIQRLVLAQTGTYMAILRATISADMDPDLRRVLLAQQGQFTTNITGVLVADMPDRIRRLLLNANTTGIRAITIATLYQDQLSEDDVALLRQGALDILATIRAAVNIHGLGATELLMLRLLRDGDGHVRKTIGAGVNAPEMDRVQRAILFAEDEKVSKTINGNVRLSKLSAHELTMLIASDAVFDRTMRGRANMEGLAGHPLALSMLRGLDAEFLRTVRAAADLTGLTPDALRLIRLTSATITRTVVGLVNLSGLNDRQKSLLDMLRGGADGKLTLGGTIHFDPSKAFSQWYTTTTQTNIAAPINDLTGALGLLLAQLQLDAAARQRQEQLQSVRNILGGMTQREDTKRYYGQDEDIMGLAKAAGIKTEDRKAESIRTSFVKWANEAGLDVPGIIYDPTGDMEKRYLASLVEDKTYGPEDYLLARWIDRNMIANGPDGVSSFDVTGPLGTTRQFGGIEWAGPWGNAQTGFANLLRYWGNTSFPAFSAGGDHAGGWRLVGENGPELEATGPARIYSAGQTRSIISGGETEAARLIAKVLAEIEAFRSEQRQIGLQSVTANNRTSHIMRKWDATGLPTERVE